MTRTRKIGKRIIIGIPESDAFPSWRESPEKITYAATLWHHEALERAERDAQIVSGEVVPGMSDLLTGQACYEDDLARDIAIYTARARSLAGIPDNLRDDLKDFDVWPSKSTAERVFDGAEAWISRQDIPSEGMNAMQSRSAWYAAIFGSRRLQNVLFARHDSLGYYAVAYRLGLAASPEISSPAEWMRSQQSEILCLGIRRLAALADEVGMHDFMRQHVQLVDLAERDASSAQDLIRAAAPHLFDAPQPAATPAPPVPADDVEIAAMALDTLRSIADAPKMRVIHKLPSVVGNSEQKSFVRQFEAIAGPGVKLVCANGISDLAADLALAWPHASDLVYRLLSDLRDGRPVRIRPTLLVGDPGSGKTRLLTELASRLGLTSVVYPCASVADGSFGGTPAQWSTRRASTPLELIRSSGTGNPLVVLDEVEKGGQSAQNGSLVHALLPMLEQHSGSTYFETALETTVDLSSVSFVATANSLNGVPEPLRDRFRIIRMPAASVEHLPALAPQILREIAIDRSVEAFTDPLAPDELDVVARVWGGGSLRKLRAAIEATLDLRDRIATPH